MRVTAGFVAAMTVTAAGCGGGGSSGAAGASGTRSPLVRPSTISGAAPTEAPQVTPTATAEAPARTPVSLPTADLSRSPRPDPTTTVAPPTTQPLCPDDRAAADRAAEHPAADHGRADRAGHQCARLLTLAAPYDLGRALDLRPRPCRQQRQWQQAWIWVLVALAAIAAVVAGILLVQRRRKARERWAAWRRLVAPLLDSAMLARSLLPEAARDIDSPGHWRDVQERVERAARGLESAAMSAPDASAAAAARDGAAALRNDVFAVEAARLLTAADRPPTAAELAEADQVTRARRAELDAALARLQQIVSPPESNVAP